MPAVEERLSVLETQMGEHNRRFSEVGEVLHRIDGKLDALRAEMLSQFRWTIGIMLTLAGFLSTLLRR